MRSIGKVNIKKLKRIIKSMTTRSIIGELSIPSVSEVIDRVPSEWFDLWEGAYTEIEGIIRDTIMSGD